jgi:NAD(P)-dependent dehydrogenase (short-subunit alcohol dehydrogenase family)
MSETSASLAGKVALVTGAGAGMGRESAVRMASAGATVLVLDVDESAAAGTVEEVRAAGGTAHAIAADVGDIAQLREVFDQVERAHGVLDVLFNHAGVSSASGFEVDEPAFDRLFAINVKSGFYATGFALPMLRRARSPSVIFTASVAGIVASPRAHIAYSASKGAVIAMVRGLAVHLAPDIRVNAIAPGPIDTETFHRGPPAPAKWATDRVPLGRLGRPEDVAAAAVFLASDASGYITGIVLPVDGGWIAQ